MASANRQQESNSPNFTTSMPVQQRQQQELIKLLAQHFHNQFYQLASASNGINPLSDAAQNQIQLPLLPGYQQQQHRAHFSNEAPIVGQRNGYDLNSLNLAAARAANQQLGGAPQSRASRSHHHHHHHQQPASANHPAEPSIMGQNASSNCLPLNEARLNLSSGQNISSNLYPFNDMNLFNALGLNLTNNQLVLSLQQQSVLQAAAAAAAGGQYEMRDDSFEIAQHSFEETASRQNSNDAINDHEDNYHHSDRKEMLKFSINTILGRCSPQTTSASSASINETTAAAARKSNHSPSLCSGDIRPSCDGQTNNNNNKLFRTKDGEKDDVQEQEQHRQQMRDCDPNESGSDSSSMNTSTPTLGQSSSSSLLFNQSLSPDHHRSANLNSVRSLAHDDSTNQQNTLRQHSQARYHQPLTFLPGSTAFPWTVAARGKPRRGMMRRAVFSDSQRVGLEKRFQLQKYISKPDRKKLAEKLGLRDSQVKIWFQNRRMKWRNSKERELLSAGGSREQTLPTRNNPNPDLSDVGETIKRLTTATNNDTPQTVSIDK